MRVLFSLLSLVSFFSLTASAFVVDKTTFGAGLLIKEEEEEEEDSPPPIIIVIPAAKEEEEEEDDSCECGEIVSAISLKQKTGYGKNYYLVSEECDDALVIQLGLKKYYVLEEVNF